MMADKKTGDPKIETLWGLLKDKEDKELKEVTIPLIQRDYAQGRKDDHAARIRGRITTDIRNSLRSKEDLDLAFVYGEITNGAFSPLDGQQRITTLWLIHWFVLFKAYENKNLDDFSVLSRFKYKTRTSSTDFCKQMCEEGNIKDLRKANSKHPDASLAQLISSRRWFLSKWKNDPTIDAMLRTLSGDSDSQDSCIESIFKEFTDKDYKESWKFLKKEKGKRVGFKILELGEDKGHRIDPDDIYIKMNSRGKPLSDFESFKADLVDHIENNKEITKKTELYSQIDNEWTNIFWNVMREFSIKDLEEAARPDSVKLDFDPVYFSFINRFVLNEICFAVDEDNNYYASSIFGEKEDASPVKINFEKIYGARLLNGKDPDDSKIAYERFDYYRDYLTEKSISSLKRVFDALQYKEIQSLIREVWGRINENYSFIPSPVYEETEHMIRAEKTAQKERVYFYATCSFFQNNSVKDTIGNTEKLDKLKTRYRRWMRVVYNLTRNYYFNDVTDMIDCMRKIRDLADKVSGEDAFVYLRDNKASIKDNLKTINDAIVAKGKGKRSAFDAGIRYQAQLLEEAEKAEQILLESNPETRIELETIIEEAENCAFFDGTIRFLYRDENGDPCWERFEDKLRNAKVLFEDKTDEGNSFKVVAVETLQAFLSLFNSFDEIKVDDSREEFIFLGKGYDDRDNCWKMNILCNDGFSSELNSLFLTDRKKLIEGIKDKNNTAYRDFIIDQKLLSYTMSKKNGKYIIEQCGKSEIYRLRVKGSYKAEDSIYLGEERKQICMKIKDEIRDESSFPCKYYDDSGYLRGSSILFERKGVTYKLTVDDSVGKQYVEKFNSPKEKEEADVFFKDH